MKFRNYLYSILMLLIISPICVFSQESTVLPFRVEMLIGWNNFSHPGINKDLEIVRDSTDFKGVTIPIGNLGKDYNYSLSVVTPISEMIDIGISIQYYQTRGYYSYTSQIITEKSMPEAEYNFSRFSPQLVVEHTQHFMWFLPTNFNIRIWGGPAFVKLRKDFNFIWIFGSSTSPLVVPAGVHITGQYHSMCPEVGGRISMGFHFLNNVSINTTIGWTIAISNDVDGSFNTPGITNVILYQKFKTPLFSRVDLGYSGFTFGAGFEFGF